MDARLGPRAIRVYVYLADALDFGQSRPVKLLSVAVALHLKRKNVSATLRSLVEWGYLEKNARAYPGGPYTYRLIYSPDGRPPVGTQ